MAEEKDMKQAKMVYDTLCKALDQDDWNYTKHEEDLVVTCGANGEDLTMEFVIVVQPEVSTVKLMSRLPFKMGEDKRVEGALATTVANYGMRGGCFDYDLRDGEIIFRKSNYYDNSILAPELFLHMIYASASMIDRYNDKFLALSTGAMTFEQFMQWENSEK